MVAIDYASVEQTVLQSHTGDVLWVDVPGVVIPDVEITDGARYILFVTAQYTGTSGNQTFGFRTVHGSGSTVFDGSTMIMEPASSFQNYDYMFLKEFIASNVPGENIIKCQFQSTSDPTDTVRMQTAVIIAKNLDNLRNTDFVYGEQDDTGAPIPHTTSFVDFARTGSFEANGTDDWLVVFAPNYLINSVSINTEYRLRLDGSTAVPDEDAPLFSEEGEDLASSKVYGLTRVFTPSAGAHEFFVQGRDDTGPGNDHQYSAVFALRLNAFVAHEFQYTEADVVLAADNTFEEVAAIDPDVGASTDVFVMGSAVVTQSSAARAAGLCATLAGVFTPTNRNTRTDTRSYDPTDKNPMFTAFVLDSESGVLDLGLEGRVEIVAEATIGNRSFVAWSAELVPIPDEPGLPEYGQGRAAIGDPPVYGATIVRS